ncbi:GDSL-type esterase/lipase family protein [Candidatus Magnetominusculus dajiuhuensis]|uniref:GDSL-type esterase/lipase family protein n=1 Tax=Candidatus Magnetominusculus dajiuhuensis TaxID=3137712 RepID=UPI003B42D86D
MRRLIIASSVLVVIVLLTVNLTAKASTEKIVFLGDSHMAFTDWNGLFSNGDIINRGINGDDSQRIYNRLESIIKDNPKKVFIMVGTNDIFRGVTPENFIKTYDNILRVLTKKLPHAEIYAMTILPVNLENDVVYNKIVVSLNEKIRQDVEYHKNDNIMFLDIYESFTSAGTLKLNPAFTFDGIHLSDQGYLNWKQQIRPYVM